MENEVREKYMNTIPQKTFSIADSPYYKGVLVDPKNGYIEGSEETVVPIRNLLDPWDWTQIFGDDHPVEIDLGCGDGGFLVAYAAAYPEKNILGTERLMGRLNKIVRKSHRLGLHNVKVARIESGYFLKYLVPTNSLAAIHLYFPDPWPKKKHVRHRLVTAEFADSCFRTLSTNGIVFLRTDNVEYYAQMKEVFGNEHRLKEVQTKDDLKQIQTDFEKQWLAQGLATNYAAYKKETNNK